MGSDLLHFSSEGSPQKTKQFNLLDEFYEIKLSEIDMFMYVEDMVRCLYV